MERRNDRFTPREGKRYSIVEVQRRWTELDLRHRNLVYAV